MVFIQALPSMKLDHILFKVMSDRYSFSCGGNDQAQLPSRINHNGAAISYSDHEAVAVEFVATENQFRSAEAKVPECEFMEQLLVPMIKEERRRSHRGYLFWQNVCVAGTIAQFAWPRLADWAQISSSRSCLISCGLGAFTFYSLVGCCSNYQRTNRLESTLKELHLNILTLDHRKIAWSFETFCANQPKEIYKKPIKMFEKKKKPKWQMWKKFGKLEGIGWIVNTYGTCENPIKATQAIFLVNDRQFCTHKVIKAYMWTGM